MALGAEQGCSQFLRGYQRTDIRKGNEIGDLVIKELAVKLASTGMLDELQKLLKGRSI